MGGRGLVADLNSQGEVFWESRSHCFRHALVLGEWRTQWRRWVKRGKIVFHCVVGTVGRTKQPIVKSEKSGRVKEERLGLPTRGFGGIKKVERTGCGV